MPGIAGFVSSPEWRPPPTLARDMEATLRTKPNQSGESYQTDEFGFCQVRFPFASGQFTWNHDRSVCVALEGELYDGTTLEDLLRMYEERGVGFAQQLNGAFVLALWDARIHQLVLTNDVFGMRPVYLAERRGGLLFATSFDALLRDPTLPRTPDPLTGAVMLSCEFAYGDRTLLKAVRLMPSGSTLVLRNTEITIRNYWRFQYKQKVQLKQESEWIDGFEFHLRQAVQRQSRDSRTQAVMLSGGLDSRCIAGLLAEQEVGSSLRSLTFGIPGCKDATVAKEVADFLKIKNEFRSLSPDFLQKVGPRGAALTGGLKSCIHMQALPTLVERSNPEVLFKGFMGDILAGSPVSLNLWGAFDRAQFRAYLVKSFNSVIPLHEHGQWFRSGRGQTEECVRGFLERQADDSYHSDGGYWYAQFCARQRQQRFILLGVELVRSEAIVRTPFCDRDFLEFMLSLPAGLLCAESLYRAAIARMFPGLAKIPWVHTGEPLVPCFRKTRAEVLERVRWALTNRGVRGFASPKPRPAVNYDHWMRTALRPWVETTLLNDDALDRTLLKPDVVRRLIREQVDGVDNSRVLGVLLSQELWQLQVANA